MPMRTWCGVTEHAHRQPPLQQEGRSAPPLREQPLQPLGGGAGGSARPVRCDAPLPRTPRCAGQHRARHLQQRTRHPRLHRLGRRARRDASAAGHALGAGALPALAVPLPQEGWRAAVGGEPAFQDRAAAGLLQVAHAQRRDRCQPGGRPGPAAPDPAPAAQRAQPCRGRAGAGPAGRGQTAGAARPGHHGGAVRQRHAPRGGGATGDRRHRCGARWCSSARARAARTG